MSKRGCTMRGRQHCAGRTASLGTSVACGITVALWRGFVMPGGMVPQPFLALRQQQYLCLQPMQAQLWRQMTLQPTESLGLLLRLVQLRGSGAGPDRPTDMAAGKGTALGLVPPTHPGFPMAHAFCQAMHSKVCSILLCVHGLVSSSSAVTCNRNSPLLEMLPNGL